MGYYVPVSTRGNQGRGEGEKGNGEIRKAMLDSPKGEKGKRGMLGSVERGRSSFIPGYIGQKKMVNL